MEDSKYFVGNMILASIERYVLIHLSEEKKGKEYKQRHECRK